MKPSIALLCLAGIWATTGLAQEVSQPKTGNKTPLLGDGYLQQVRRPLEQIFAFTFEGPQLKLDRNAWGAAAKDAPKPARAAHPLEVVFRQMQSTAGTTSGGMSAGSVDRQLHFSGTNLSGRLHTRGETVRILLEESQSPQRTLEFNDDGQGGFRLQVTHPDGDLILLHQARKGHSAAVVIGGGQTFAGQGDSFVSLFRQHRQVMEDRILPVLQQFGIQPILSPQTPQVRKAVLAQLVGAPKAGEAARSLFADLDSDKFEVRDQASRLLSERFAIYQYLIQEKLRDKSLSVEVRARLTAILAQHPDSQRVAQVVAALDLLQDGHYLVLLLDHVTADDASKLISQLEKVTGQKLGSDPAAWKQWAKKNRK